MMLPKSYLELTLADVLALAGADVERDAVRVSAIVGAVEGLAQHIAAQRARHDREQRAWLAKVLAASSEKS